MKQALFQHFCFASSNPQALVEFWEMRRLVTFAFLENQTESLLVDALGYVIQVKNNTSLKENNAWIRGIPQIIIYQLGARCVATKERNRVVKMTVSSMMEGSLINNIKNTSILVKDHLDCRCSSSCTGHLCSSYRCSAKLYSVISFAIYTSIGKFHFVFGLWSSQFDFQMSVNHTQYSKVVKWLNLSGGCSK